MQPRPATPPDAPRARSVRAETDDGTRVALVRYPAGEVQPRHAHDVDCVTLVLAGALAEEVGAGCATARPLHAGVKPRGTHHEDRFGPVGALLLQLHPSPRARAGGLDLGGWGWRRCATPRPWIALARALLADADPRVLGEAAGEALAATFRPGPCDDARRPGPRWLRDVRAQLEDEGADAPSLTALAAAHGVHRVHLGRAFRRHYGLSPVEFRRRVRLERAAALVARPAGASLADAAQRAGFADQAHLTREFSRRLGTTPARFRDLVAEPKLAAG